MVESYEVRAGLVLRLDPARLIAGGAVCTEHPIKEPHYFICLEVRGRESDWVATSSKAAPGRIPVRRKWGHPDWVNWPTHAVMWQVWTTSWSSLRVAASIDRSQRGNRNYAALDFCTEAFDVAA